MRREDLNHLLQHADPSELSRLAERIASSADVRVLAAPSQQTLMVPVHDPVADIRFYGGEVLVTQAIVEVNTVKGWAMVMDKSPDTALAAAICDGAFAAGIELNAITALAQNAQALMDAAIREETAQTAATRVSFDMMSDMSGNM